MRVGAVVLCIGGVVSQLWPLPARAADGGACAEAEMRIKRAVGLRSQEKDEEALAELRQAEEACPTATGLAQMALAEQALGRWKEAEQHLEQALGASGDAWILKHREQLERARALIGQRLGRLSVSLETPGLRGAELRVGGEAVGELPLSAPLRVTAGTVLVEVRAQGYAPLVREVIVPAGGLAREVVRLVPLPVTPASPLPRSVLPWATVKGGPEEDEGANRMLGRHERAGRPHLVRRLGIVGLSAGAAFVGGGVAAQLVREGQVRAWNRDPMCVGFNGGELPPPCASRLHIVMVAEPLAIVGYAVGGVAMVGGVVLLALPQKVLQGHREARVQLTPGPGPGDVGLAVQGRF